MNAERIQIVVGGKTFSTMLSTVTERKALGCNLSKLVLNTTEVVIDRDPKYFRLILQWLRDGEMMVVSTEPEKNHLQSELEWYGPFVGGNPAVYTEAEYAMVRNKRSVPKKFALPEIYHISTLSA